MMSASTGIFDIYFLLMIFPQKKERFFLFLLTIIFQVVRFAFISFIVKYIKLYKKDFIFR